jgi:phosphocarrier protein
MKQFTYTIQDPNGMHARPAGALATFAKQFVSDIRVRAKEKDADAKRLLSLMSLGAVHGTELVFSVEGVDEEAAAVELQTFLNKHPTERTTHA